MYLCTGICTYGFEEDNKGLDAADCHDYRRVIGPHISCDAGTATCSRPLFEWNSSSIAAASDLCDALSDILPHRAERPQAS